MQLTIDTAQRNYLLSSYLRNKTKEEKHAIPVHKSKDAEITLLDKGAAFLAGAAISGIVSNVKQVSSKFFLSALEKTTILPTLDETKEVTEKILKKIDIQGKPVRALFVEDNPKEVEKVADIIARNTLVGFRRTFDISPKGLISRGIKFWAGANAALIAKGKKASFLLNERVALTSKATHQGIFHELGHAKVAGNKFLRPLLTIGKRLPIVAAFSGVCALEHTPRPEDSSNPKSNWEKIQDFLDVNAGKITFFTFIPMLAEKFIASAEGLKEVQPHIGKQKIQSMKKLYRIGLVTYLATAFATSAGIGLGNKVQNNIIKQKQSPQDVYNLLI